MNKVQTGLALGSGAARGYAHIGVLQVFEREGIPIDIITGSSIGSIIGAAYAAGIGADMLKEQAFHIRRRHWVDLCIPKMGLIAGNKIETVLNTIMENKSFEELDIPLGVMATDLYTKKSILIKEGNVARAVRASIAIPGIFHPVKLQDKLLVDGGLLERVPGAQARKMGANFVVGVELGFGTDLPIKSIYDVIVQTFDIMGNEIQILKKYDCDVLITPDLSDIDPLNFSINQIRKCINEGKRATEQVLPQILKIARKRGKR